jgi:hypothetical protein
MFSRIRKRLTYANVAATMALFFAISGGAFAASHYLITSTKQIKPSVLSSLKGKAGPAGKNGVNGANGAQGPAGATGPQGPAGSSGAAGTGVTSVALASGNEHCKKGGTEFTSATGKTYACNGEPAKGGGGGWPVVLPAGKTETGMWSVSGGAEVVGLSGEKLYAYSPISFADPLAAPLPETNIHYLKPGEQGTEDCPGSAAKPEAKEGELCVYAQEEEVTAFDVPEVPTTTGVVLLFKGPKETFSHAFGSYAVTAGEEG